MGQGYSGKMRKHFLNILVALAILTSSLIWAGPVGGYAGSFLRIGASARSMAMGSSFTGMIDKTFPGYFNPASVSRLGKKQLGFMYHSMPLDRQLTVTSFSTSLPPTAGIGIGWVNAGVKDIQGRNSAGEKTNVMSVSENAFYFTFAQSIKDWLSVGINVKLFYQQLPVNKDQLSGKGTGFDVGVMLTPKNFMPLSIVIQDINAGYQWNTADLFDGGNTYKDSFPLQARVGTYRSIGDLLVTADMGVLTDNEYAREISIRSGVEYRLRENYSLRAGFGNGRVGFGAGMNYALLKQNDTWVDYTAILELASGLAHVFTFSIEL